MTESRFFLNKFARAFLLTAVLATPLHATARDEVVANKPATTATLQGDAARPPAAHWRRAELYFGLGSLGTNTQAEYDARWHAFLDEEVTPRFPDGFSVIDAYGQWQRRDPPTIERLNSKVLVILYQGKRHRRDLDAIRAAWKQRTGDESVLLSITSADVSF